MNLKLSTLRVGYAVGGRLLPRRTTEHAAGLFSTPLSSSRARATAALAETDARRETLTVNSERIATYVWGDPATQPYVLFMHGWSSFGLRFRPWVAKLRALGYAMVGFDQPGHGMSTGNRCLLTDFVQTAREVGSHYGNAAAVIAHSMGGAAVTMAMGQPWRAERVVLIAPAADPVDATRRFARMVGLSEHLRERMSAMFERHTGVSIHDLQAHRHVLAFSQPALIVHDLDDLDVPWEEGERYARFWPDARLLTTQGLGHRRILEDMSVMDASLAFLQGERIGERVVSTHALPFGLV
jgi:pimeloyl-ACP methyl ester carboxylesterase